MLPGKLGNMNFEKVFRNKKVFVTGHTGFKGSWLITWLHLIGAEIKGFALSPENSFDLYNVIDGDSLCESVISDIRDKDTIKKELLAFQPDYLFHLAAQPLVLESYNDPIFTFEVNTLGTANVLDSLRYLEKPCIAVIITTDKVYHNYENGVAYKEVDRIGGYDPYSASKGAAEIIIDSYINSFFNPSQYQYHQKSISVGRAGNVIGGGDWAKNRIIPDIVRALSVNKPIVVRSPNAVRPWQHVLEPLSGYLTLAANQTENPSLFTEAFNFGPHLSDNLNVQQIVEEAIKIWGDGTCEFIENNNTLHEANLLQLDIQKAKNMLGWQTKLNAIEALDKTIKWYKEYLANKVNVIKLLHDDINEFSLAEFN